MADAKNPCNVQIGLRIKQARKQAGFNTAAKLLETINAQGIKWGKGRLGNYEAGISQPSPDDIVLLAKITKTSACWLMFGTGSIHEQQNDLQTLRHHNLHELVNDCIDHPMRHKEFLAATQLSAIDLENYLLNPLRNIPDKLARACEKYANREHLWMDKQHNAEAQALPFLTDNASRLLRIFSDLDNNDQCRLIAIAEIFHNSVLSEQLSSNTFSI